MTLAPIVLFVYNRPWHTQQTVEALRRCELASDSDLYIFADGPKDNATEDIINRIAEVRQFIHSIDGFKSIQITESPTNKGLANSVIQGVSKITNKHGKVIVVEDDIVAHPFFLRFMNEALEFYATDKRIYSIGGFNYGFSVPNTYKNDVYIVHRSESHGWATWKNRWEDVDWSISDSTAFFSDNKKIKRFNRGGHDMANMLKLQINGVIDSWAIRWDYHLFKHNAFCLRPIKTFVENIGFDGSGIHCGAPPCDNYQALLYDRSAYEIHFIKRIKQKHRIAINFHDFWEGKPPTPLFKRTKRLLKRILRSIKIMK